MHLKILNKIKCWILSIPLIFQIVSWGHNLLLFYGLPTHLQKLSEIQDWWMDFLILHTCVHMWFWQQNLAHILRFIQEVNNVLEKIKIIRCIVFCVTKHMFSSKFFHDLIIFLDNLRKTIFNSLDNLLHLNWLIGLFHYILMQFLRNTNDQKV